MIRTLKLRLAAGQFGYIPIIGKNQKLVGVLTGADGLKYQQNQGRSFLP